jgi:hypothetical protein
MSTCFIIVDVDPLCLTFFENNISGTFLLNNYKQALDILCTAPTALKNAKRELGIEDDTVFKRWILEELGYLQGLKVEPFVETLEIEYCKRLLTLWASK